MRQLHSCTAWLIWGLQKTRDGFLGFFTFKVECGPSTALQNRSLGFKPQFRV